MILDKFVIVGIGGTNIKHFKKKYTNITIGSKIEIPVDELTLGSNIKINCICDNCGIKRVITYQKYKESEKKSGVYSCQKCSHKKRKKTNLEKYGVENYVEFKDFNKQAQLTLKEKYGENITNVFQSKWFKNYIKKYNLEKYGVEHIFQSKDIYKKYQQTIIDKYGVDYYYQSDDFKNKTKNTCLERYGVEKYSNTEKAVKTKLTNGFSVSLDKLNDWEIYKRNVRRLSRKNIIKLYKEWDGYDYYDDEFIVENLSLNHTDINFPTIDHKTSIFYGFHNNITEENISKISNLCITKRSINSKKSINNSL